MKKLILIAVAIASITTLAYAGSEKQCTTVGRLTENLDLDEARATEVKAILASYKQVKELAMAGHYAEIPAFIETRQTALTELLSESEMQVFKKNVSAWAGEMNFSKYVDLSGKNAGIHN